MRFSLFCSCLALLIGSPLSASEPAFPVQAKRILILGDSITYAGHYPVVVEANLRLAKLDHVPEIINLGLSSETVSGLSEPTHPFPRPGVHERLERALQKIQPDVVVACYGVNDGIYAPFNEKSFDAFQKGINLLIEKVHAHGAKLVLMTPPPFDALPLRKAGKLQGLSGKKFDWTEIYERYDEEVLQPYAQWEMKQKARVEMLIDLHTPVLQFMNERRKSNPDFTLSGDGIHLNNEGHEILARAILKAWNIPVAANPDPELLNLINKKQAILKHAWLSEVSHKRPGVQAGLPMAEALQQVKELDHQIQARIK